MRQRKYLSFHIAQEKAGVEPNSLFYATYPRFAAKHRLEMERLGYSFMPKWKQCIILVKSKDSINAETDGTLWPAFQRSWTRCLILWMRNSSCNVCWQNSIKLSSVSSWSISSKMNCVGSAFRAIRYISVHLWGKCVRESKAEEQEMAVSLAQTGFLKDWLKKGWTISCGPSQGLPWQGTRSATPLLTPCLWHHPCHDPTPCQPPFWSHAGARVASVRSKPPCHHHPHTPPAQHLGCLCPPLHNSRIATVENWRGEPSWRWFELLPNSQVLGEESSVS